MDYSNIMEIYRRHYKNSFKTYSKLEKERLIEVTPKRITKWRYNTGKSYRIFIKDKKA